MGERVSYIFGDKTIADLINLQKNSQLNLEPAFQRDSVWRPLHRRRFIQTILDGYPVPSIFLYRREHNGWPVYDVLDGKQRLETIFKFAKVNGVARQIKGDKLKVTRTIISKTDIFVAIKGNADGNAGYFYA